MGFRDWMRRWFGASDDVNPDEPIEIGVVPIGRGPFAVDQLRHAGFDAGGHDAFNIVSSVSSGYRILVPQHQAEAAVAKAAGDGGFVHIAHAAPILQAGICDFAGEAAAFDFDH